MAQYNPGADYLDGSGVQPDREEAKRWFERSAEQGYTAAEYKLGWLYSRDENSGQNLKLAVHWFHLAAEQGEALALYALGVMAANGEGLPKDAVNAFALLTVAAKQGFDPALKARTQLEAVMTADEVRRGNDLAARWKPPSETQP